MTQHNKRLANHGPSIRSKAPTRPPPSPDLDIYVGDLVYLRTERSKTKSRPRYLVCNIEGEWCNIRKFIGSQLRSNSYRVRRSDCLKVRSDIPPLPTRPLECDGDDASDLPSTTATKLARPPPDPPDIADDHRPPLNPSEVASVPHDPGPLEPPDIPHELSTPQDEPIPPSTNPVTSDAPNMPSNSRRYPLRRRCPPSYLTDYELK